MTIRKAERKRARLRLGISGPGGSGKTYSALLLAFGLGGKVGLIDTERGSGDLYAHLGDYDIINITPPYTIAKYRAAITEFEAAGYSSIIIDSLSHAWAGEGGLLEKQGKIADSGKGNSYTAWRSVTPEHNALVEAMLGSPCHIIATMRSKSEYVQEKVDGKTIVRKIGMSPIQRDGMEYEMTVFIDLSVDHTASVSKDRTSLFDGTYFNITKDTGKQLLAWLETGSDPTPLEGIKEPPAPPATEKEQTQVPELTEKEKMLFYLRETAAEGVQCLKDAFAGLPASKLKQEVWVEHGAALKALAEQIDAERKITIEGVDIDEQIPF